MKQNTMLLSLVLMLVLLGSIFAGEPMKMIESPEGILQLTVELSDQGALLYSLDRKGEAVIKPSTIAGFDFKNADSLANYTILDHSVRDFSETWEMPWGEQRMVENIYRELAINLQAADETKRALTVRFRLYDDGLGFRYEFPEQEDVEELIFMDEHTDFQMAEDLTAWWIPGDWDNYEYLYVESPLSKIDALAQPKAGNPKQCYTPENAVNTPVTMRSSRGLHIALHEAALINFPGMTLKVDNEALKFTSELVGSTRTGYKAKVALPFNTPWRTIQVAESAGALLDSDLIVNLNEPNKLGDVSWFKPTKYMGIWVEMHLGTHTWSLDGVHGATTQRAKRLIDFAAKNDIGAVLVEGWNVGWEDWVTEGDREGIFDFITPYPDYDVREVARYAAERGVELILHHETSAAVRTYEKQLNKAFALMRGMGSHGVKTGYVGPLCTEGEFHHGQYMVNHFQYVTDVAASNQVAVNAHEPIKATGLRRTYPNVISREGARAMEYNMWSADGGNPPDHLTIIPFTRMLGGPIDYTPGIFNITLEPYTDKNQVNTTLAKQLAAFVVLYSPIQMASDLIESYEGHPAFQFIRDCDVDWEQSLVLNGEIGEYVSIARQSRKTLDWFLGCLTDENARDMTIICDFLDEGTTYLATVYADGDDAHWKENPTAYKIYNLKVTSESELPLKLAPGGGAAVSFKKL